MSALTRALNVFYIEKRCGSCGGAGTQEKTRELFLDELSDKQSSFLYQAELERSKARNGELDDDKSSQQKPNIPSNINTSAPSGANPSSVSNPGGGPPVRGNTQNY